MQESEPPVAEQVDARVAGGEPVLVAHVPHPEQGRRDDGDQGQYDDAFEVHRIADVRAFARHGAGNGEEGIESVGGAVQPAQFSAFFKYRMHLF